MSVRSTCAFSESAKILTQTNCLRASALGAVLCLAGANPVLASHPTCYGPINPYESQEALARTAAANPGEGGKTQAVPIAERDALMAIFNSMGGANWSVKGSWTVGDPCQDNWPGVTCNVERARVIGLESCDNNIAGQIPPEIGQLTELEFLWLKGGFGEPSFSGAIPSEIGNLTKLKYLRLDTTALSEPIPPEIGDLQALRMLLIGVSEIEGPLPEEMGQLSNLRWLSIDANSLGTLPNSLTQLNRLELLRLQGVSGPIPPQLGSLAGMRELDLRGELTGEIPPELGNLAHLTWLVLGNNEGAPRALLTGTIPESLGNLARLETLSISNTALSPVFPDSLSKLQSLKQLSLSYNEFNTNIPAFISQLRSLEALYLRASGFEGEIPEWIGDLQDLQYIFLFGNELSGPIPSSLSSLAQLDMLDLSGNKLTGSLADWLDGTPAVLNELTYLDMSDNQLTGPIPASIGQAGKLRVVFLNNNRLSGVIPASMGEMQKLFRLGLSDNALTGSIPPELGNAPELEQIYLQGNQLSGELPSSLKGPLCCSTHLLLGQIGRESNFSWNALYTNDAVLNGLLDQGLDQFFDQEIGTGDFSATQTLPPENLRVTASADTSVSLDWDGIEYTADPGRFRVYRGTAEDGPFEAVAVTASKAENSLTVSNLLPGITYHFRIRSETDPHANNTNLVTSAFSQMVSATTSGEAPTFVINAGLSDSWYNPATAGQGFFVNVFPDIQIIFLAWFTYDTERPAEGVTAQLGEPGHRWLTAFGEYNGNRAELQIEMTTGGIFNAAEPAPSQALDGTITVEFDNCETGTISFDIPSIEATGQIPVQRIALDRVPLCETLGSAEQTN